MIYVDRVEGNYVICEKEDSTFIALHKDNLPKDIKEGNVLELNENQEYITLKQVEKQRKEEMLEIQKKINQ